MYVCFTSLSAADSTYCPSVGRLVNHELERMWKKVMMTF